LNIARYEENSWQKVNVDIMILIDVDVENGKVLDSDLFEISNED